MPIYEYKCKNCENIFEVLATSASDVDNIRCAKCQSEKVDKVISAGSFRLSPGPSLSSAPPSGCGGKSGFS